LFSRSVHYTVSPTMRSTRALLFSEALQGGVGICPQILRLHQPYPPPVTRDITPPRPAPPHCADPVLSSPLSSSPLLCSPMPPSPLLSSPLLSAQLNDT